jgi:hypothetical protein
VALAAGVAVAAGFAAVKASGAAAGWASAAWTAVWGHSVVRADPTDLLALPALAAAWYAFRAAGRRPATARAVRLVATLVVLPAAGLAMAATSAAYYPDAIAVAQLRGAIVVGTGSSAGWADYRRVNDFLASTDGGETFHRLYPDSPSQAPSPALDALAGARTSGCSASAPRHCFRVVAGRLAVEETADGGASWRVAWQVTDAARARLAKRYPELGDVHVFLSSQSLVVLDRPGGFVVVVANGRDGMARRDPAGHWTRIGFGAATEPVVSVPAAGALDPSTLPLPIVGGLVAGVAVILAWYAGTAVRVGRGGHALVGLVPAGVGGAMALGGGALWQRDAFGGAGLAFLGCVLLGIGWVIVAAVMGGGRFLAAGSVARAVLLGLATAAAVVIPFAIQYAAGLPAHGVAAAWAVTGVAGSATWAACQGYRRVRHCGLWH